MIGCLGRDEFGARLRERLAGAGVDVSDVRAVDHGSGMSVAIQQAGGDYAAIVVSGANRDIDPGQVETAAAAIRGSRVLLLQHEIREDASARAAAIASAAGVSVVLNAAPARPLGDLTGLVDVLVVNSVEAEMLGAGPVEDLGSALAAARSLRSLAPAVVVTAGSAGVAAATEEGTVRIEAHQVGPAETHGAGDVFVGALGARLALGDSLAQALRYANAAAALHVGTPLSEREALGPAAVEALLEGRPAGGPPES
jgi:ribokinase